MTNENATEILDDSPETEREKAIKLPQFVGGIKHALGIAKKAMEESGEEVNPNFQHVADYLGCTLDRTQKRFGSLKGQYTTKESGYLDKLAAEIAECVAKGSGDKIVGAKKLALKKMTENVARFVDTIMEMDNAPGQRETLEEKASAFDGLWD